MSNVASIFGKAVRKHGSTRKNNWPLQNQMIGLEVEAEGGNNVMLPRVDNMAYWTQHDDGSLLHGREYVLQRPLKGDDLAGAIDELFEKPTKFQRSMTGSTHIHLDMTEETTTAETVKSITFMMYCLEGVIFQIGDPSREFNGYTNKLISAPEALIGAVFNATEADGFRYLKDVSADVYNIGRYYGLNLMALNTYGSIEFRYFPTATSQEELESWIRLVMCIKKAATEVTITELIDIFNSEDRYERFLNMYLMEWKPAFKRWMPLPALKEKARKAVAVSQSCTSKQVAEFNPKAVLENKALSKFVKVVKKDAADVLPVVILKRGQRAPAADTIPPSVLINPNNGEAFTNLHPVDLGWYPVHANMIGLKAPTNWWDRVLATLQKVEKENEDPNVKHVCERYIPHVKTMLQKAFKPKLPGLRKGDPASFVVKPAKEMNKEEYPKIKITDVVVGNNRLWVGAADIVREANEQHNRMMEQAAAEMRTRQEAARLRAATARTAAQQARAQRGLGNNLPPIDDTEERF